jgi:amino acid transporter
MTTKNKSKRNIRTVTFFNWLSLNFFLPLLPLLLGITISYLREARIPYSNLFGGTELFFFTVTILIATRSDLDSEEYPVVFKVISAFLLIFAIFCTGLFAFVYINQNIQNIGLNEKTTADFAILIAVSASLICLLIEGFIATISFDRYKHRVRDRSK